MKKKILTIVGARPQFIKTSVVIKAIKSFTELEIMILHTGQHFDFNMSDLFFKELEIPKPYKNLNISSSGLQGDHTARMLSEIEKEIIELNPDIVLVFGDTNSTLAGALAAAKMHVPVAHVESGMRCFNKKIPEEVNRVIVDHLSTILFCSTEESTRNLEKESITKNVYHVGDVMVDSIMLFKDFANKKKPEPFILDLIKKDYFLLTLHRQETTSVKVLKTVLEALSKSSKEIIFPVHPRTKNMIQKHKILFSDSLIMIEPQGYLDIIRLIQHSKAVFTDSGGLQKEAAILQKRCFTLREETEWTETVREGWNMLLGFDPDKIKTALIEAMKPFPKNPFPAEKYYGDGKASKKIVEHIKSFLS